MPRKIIPPDIDGIKLNWEKNEYNSILLYFIKILRDPTNEIGVIKPAKFNRFKKRRPDDKILDNKYNKGEVEYEEFTEPKIDPSFRLGRLNESYDSYDHYRMIDMNNFILGVYKDTIWYKSYDINKRIPKQELSEIYHFIKEQITDTSFTNTEIFIIIAQFLDVNMSILYKMIGLAYKCELIDELKKYKPKLIEDNIAPLF